MYLEFSKKGEMNEKSLLIVKQIVNDDKQVKFTEFADSVLEHTKDQVHQYVNRPATQAQLKTMKKMEIKIPADVRVWQADGMIKQKVKCNKINNKELNNWFKPYLQQLVHKLPAKGSNSIYCYYYGMASKHNNTKSVDIGFLKKYLSTDLEQINRDYDAGLKSEADYVSKSKLNQDLKLSSKLNVKSNLIRKKKYNTTKNKINNLATNWWLYSNKKNLDLATKLNVSLATLKRLKSKLKKIIEKNSINHKECGNPVSDLVNSYQVRFANEIKIDIIEINTS